jgi:DNA-directed RNA polymerase specialized sigma24 family protein
MTTSGGAADGRTDEALWAAYTAGEDKALGELMARHAEGLYRYLVLSSGRPEIAAGYLTDAWRAVASYRGGVEGFGSWRGWLYAVATQRAVPATRPEPFGLAELLEEVRGARGAVAVDPLWQLLAELPRQLRQPLLLVGVAGLTVGEAATACNFSGAKTLACLGRACRGLARSRLFEDEAADEV